MEFELRTFDALSLRELYAVLRLRSDVFVVEQGCVYSELDGLDFEATHLLGFVDQQLAAYARWFPEEDRIVLGRIVLDSSARGEGQGRSLIQRALEEIGDQVVKIHAQYALRPYYESLGWVVDGEVYDDYGVDHVIMMRCP